MISVIVPTLNDESGLAGTLESLVPAVIEGLVSEVVVADGGSSDMTLVLADGMGARIVERVEGGRGARRAAGAAAAKGEFLMFLEPGAQLQPDWEIEARSFIKGSARAGGRIAAAFRFALDDPSRTARRTEFWARMNFSLLGLPLAEQGLLISKRFYDELGGYRVLGAMEDADLFRRIGPDRIVVLRAAAVMSRSPARARAGLIACLRNLAALALLYLRAPARVVARIAG